MDNNKSDIIDHFIALKRNLLKAILGFSIATIISYMFSDKLLIILRKPIQKVLAKSSNFIVLTPQEYFFTEIKVALFFGMFLSSPWILYQIWLFISPGLYKQEKKYIFIFTITSTSFFLLGGLFCYFIVFPAMFNFFLNTIPSDIIGNYSLGMLYSFVINTILAFSIIFEAPIIIFLLVSLSIINIKTLTNIRKHIIVSAFIIGAILTPPDPITQIMLAIPLIILYEIGILGSKIILKYKIKRP
jgi:sec-independent protein translocase protein TatC